MFHHFWGQSCVLLGFFVSSRALLVQNARFLTPLYLEKNNAYRKRIVKYITKLHVSTPKKVNVALTKNLQLADTAPVLLEIGGKLSTQLPPKRLVEQCFLSNCLNRNIMRSKTLISQNKMKLSICCIEIISLLRATSICRKFVRLNIDMFFLNITNSFFK